MTVVVVVLVAALGVVGPRTSLRAQGAPTISPFSITSPTLPNGSGILQRYACRDEGGSNISPPLAFSSVPNNAQSLVLKVDDPDAPNGYNAVGNSPQAVVHWLLYNMDPMTSGIQEGASPPPGSAGASYDGTTTYQGPCPPQGTHRYFFRLYALNSPVSLARNASPTWTNVMTAMTGKVVACATLVGTYASGQNQQPNNQVLPAPPVDNLCPTQLLSPNAQPSQQPNNPGQPAQPIANPGQPTQPISNAPAAPAVQIVPSTTSAQIGEVVGFAYTVSATSAPVQGVLVAFGDGAVQTGNSVGGTVTHVYPAAGNYSTQVTATDINGQTGQATATVSIGESAAPTTGQTGTSTMSIAYSAGWNLIAAPPGTVISGASLPLYTWQNGDVAYAPSNTTQPGSGYWAYFAAPSAVVMPIIASTTVTSALQPNAYAMIGNAASLPATVSGADVVYVYNSTTGYQVTNVLQPGQGAWALSFTGGNVTLTYR
jgi:Raf kinase inhibitor-like YbhB/YbcL family protein